MTNTFKLSYIVSAVLLLTSISSYAQDTPQEDFTQQIEFSHDNDFIVLSDRYYSSGLFLSYRKALKKGLTKNNKEQFSLTINQEVYTPSQTQSTNSDIFDRPYAGFSGLKASWSFATPSELFKTDVLTGIAGLNSGAGGLQRAFHSAVGILDSPLWIDEINDSFHLNTYFYYVKEWNLSSNPTGSRFAFTPNLAFGSKDIYIEPETVFYFGKRNSVDQSVAYNRIGTTAKEFYFALRSSYRYVLHNGLIDGNLFGDDSPVLRDSKNSVWRLGLDINRRIRRSDYKLAFRYNTKETQASGNHQYITFSYGYRF